ncbi:class I SAM-dependent rRNA methyltransferase [Candidatus Methylacidithermus pantelleriae]|uniref:LSU m5C1962 methyltransferase RlmI n=1 Tax=Candidatus Methylacidithermus pantelleriae TaxID=2744239 RepID=A0A8J2BIK9_9BACT|nr:class I SAM-dependent rRNA methyltransferase [Candidatus Methylacidithermus pantelleriae]CAF0689369.1 LSU m5C1962 methyltransferase RlmI [Candidatus Methylacidithermus pantelleriae]
MAARIYLTPGRSHRVLRGHPWVFRGEIARIEGNPADGQCVELYDARERFVGMGMYNSRSQITVRLYSRQLELLDERFLSEATSRAIAYRRALHGPEDPPAERLVFSEADGLPGLIVDRYQRHLVVQTLTAGMARVEEVVVSILQEQLNPEGILLRNDAPVRHWEGLERAKRLARGSYQGPLQMSLLGVPTAVDLWEGQKTGLYLDQIENYRLVASLAPGRRVLDCFCYQGCFALVCLRQGAREAVAVDQSVESLARGQQSAQKAGLSVQWVQANAFDWLRESERRKDRFDLIVMDPPSFTKTKEQRESALRGYHELHIRALRLLSSGGILATFCCSHNIRLADWQELIGNASSDTGVPLRFLGFLRQAKDHPSLVHVPETEYLKGFLLERAS